MFSNSELLLDHNGCHCARVRFWRDRDNAATTVVARVVVVDTNQFRVIS